MNETPLYTRRKQSHQRRCFLKSAVNLMRWWGRRKERRVSKRRDKNKRPGRTHLQTKASSPISDCNSVLVADFLTSYLGNTSSCNSRKQAGVTDIVKVACSKRSDNGERCEVKKAMKSRGGLGREVREHLSPSLAFIFSHSFLLRTAPHYLNAWNRL